MIRLLLFIGIAIAPFLTSAQLRLCSEMTSRAISINEDVFEVKMNILGKFYLNPNIQNSKVVGDSIFLKGIVSRVYLPIVDVQVFVCRKAKRTFREKIARIELYEVKRYGGATDSIGQFDVSLNYKNETLLFRDYSSGLDGFLFLEVKPTCN